MSNRYDLKTWRKSGQGKAYAIRIGSAWTDDKGTIRLAFDALPLSDENGRVQAFLEEPRERPVNQSGGISGQEMQRGGGRGYKDDLGGDDIPFEMEWR